jgi:hypothetical protein
MNIKTICRVLAMLLLAVMLFSLCGCAPARKLRPNARANKTVATAGELEITYDTLYYITMTRIKELKRVYGEDVLNDPAKQAELKEFVKENLFGKAEALLLLAEEYGISITSGEIGAEVQADMEEILANEKTFNNDRDAYIASLNAEYLTDRYIRTYLAVEEYLPIALVQEMLERGDINDSDEAAMTLIHGADFLRTVHVFIDKHDGIFSPEEDLAHANALQAKIAAHTDPAARYGEMRLAIGGQYNKDISDTTGNGYYFARGEMQSEYETAAFALEEYGVSPVVETADGYYIIMRMPKDAAYIEESFQLLKEKSYYVALNKMVEEKLNTVPVEMTDFGNSLDLLDLPAVDANGGEVAYVVGIVVAVALGVGIATAAVVVLIRVRGKKASAKGGKTKK